MTNVALRHGAIRRSASASSRVSSGHLKARPVIVRQPKEELIGVQVLDYQGRSSPLMALGLNARCQNMFAQRLTLIVFKADKDSTMACPALGPVADLIEDQLETEQADLT